RRLPYQFVAGQFGERKAQAREAASFEGPPNPIRVELRTPTSVLHHELSRLAENLVIHVVGGPDRQPGVAGGGLDVDVCERRPVEDLAVGHAVEGHATCETDRFLPGLAVERVQEPEVSLFQDTLKRSSNGLQLWRQQRLGGDG